MRLTITGAGCRLGRALAAQLAGDDLRLVDFPAPPLGASPKGSLTPPLKASPKASPKGSLTGAPCARIEGDLRDPQVARSAVEGAGALVHLAALPSAWPQGMPKEEALDLCARGTFELLRAAVGAGVPRVVLGSTLDLFEAYPPGWAVHEGWRPRPGTDMRELGPYLAELVGRELARAGWPLLVVCLRLGRLWSPDDDRAPDARSLALDDAVQALRLGLAFHPGRPGRGARRGETADRRAGRLAWRGVSPDGWVVPQDAGWHAFHIPGGQRARFPLAGAAHPSFGYTPQHDFGEHGAPPGAPTSRRELPGTPAPQRAGGRLP